MKRISKQDLSFHSVPPLKTMEAGEELEYLFEIYGPKNYPALFGNLFETFRIIQRRGQMLLSLVTICLTITGFSGPRMAQSCLFSRYALILGLALVLLSAIVVLAGPLRVRWGTRERGKTVEESLIMLIRLRDQKTRLYYYSLLLLVGGLSAYVVGVIAFLLWGF